MHRLCFLDISKSPAARVISVESIVFPDVIHPRRGCSNFSVVIASVCGQIFQNDNQDVEVKHKRFVLTSSWKPEPGADVPALVLIHRDDVMPDPNCVRQLDHLLPTRSDKKAVCPRSLSCVHFCFVVARFAERHSWGCGLFF